MIGNFADHFLLKCTAFDTACKVYIHFFQNIPGNSSHIFSTEMIPTEIESNFRDIFKIKGKPVYLFFEIP